MIAGARRLLSTSAAFLATLHSGVAHAAWPSDPHVNVPVCTAANDQAMPRICSDGAGGAIVTWMDKRDSLVTHSDIYAQRVNVAGVPQWTQNGVALCTAANDQLYPTIVSDGAGGAIVTWQDTRSASSDIYAQRVDAAGVPQWTADGIALCAAAGNQQETAIASDGAGGAIVVWMDGRGGVSDIYAQRVDAAGVPQWNADGVALCAAANIKYFPTIASDGAGGAIVTWEDFRNGTNYDIYTQRVNAAGIPQWTTDAVALCTAAGYEQAPAIASDGAGGALVAWMDGRGGSIYDIFAQRVNADGAPQWAADGAALCAAPNNQFYPAIVSDGEGGAIVSWQDNRSGTSYDIYVQRVSAAGAPQWTGGGVALCTAPGYQSNPKIVSDGAGGAIVAWEDARSGGILTHIYARRVNAAGVAQWAADGVALCTAPNGQFNPAIAPDGAGGAIVTWDDVRSGTNRHIYAQNINADGTLGGTVVSVPPLSIAASFAIHSVQPNPSVGDLRVSFSLSDGTPATLELYDLTGRRIESLSVGGLGPGEHVTSLTPHVRSLPPGVYCASLIQGSHRVFRKVAIIR